MASPGEAILTNPASDWPSDEAIVQQLLAAALLCWHEWPFMTQGQRSLRQTLAAQIVLKKQALTKTVFTADLGWLFPVACLTLQLPSGRGQTRPAKNKP